ncbi:hypothetical protein A9Q83_06430 [Alphaproteobacteria bacterium 46_93_T64]|nr:hypothetical protein A9Q83_06430 [Alphaproteobacteria bacterium 46_93_T64]
MTYEITLIEADIRAPLNGNMKLSLDHEGVSKAQLEYSWDTEQFTAVFRGHAPSLPFPAHPTDLLQKPIQALNKAKTADHHLITDVFLDQKITIHLTK